MPVKVRYRFKWVSTQGAGRILGHDFAPLMGVSCMYTRVSTEVYAKSWRPVLPGQVSFSELMI